MGTVGYRPGADAEDVLELIQGPSSTPDQVVAAFEDRPDVLKLAIEQGLLTKAEAQALMKSAAAKRKGQRPRKANGEAPAEELGPAMKASADCAWCRYGKPAAVGAALGLGLAYVTGLELAKGALWGGAGGLLYGQVWNG